MILGDENEPKAGGDGTTLDDLFRRAGVRHPEALALVDPINRESFTEGAPRSLTFAQADRAIGALAARLHQLGLATDTVIAVQLPNTIEGIIALLGVMRARMIAAPVPLLWRQKELVDGLMRIDAKAIITTARVGETMQVDLAMQAAVELFPIRYVCAFGRDLPDGVVPLDDIFAADAEEMSHPPARPGSAAAHVAAVTFDMTTDGVMPVARNQQQLVAGGLMPFAESGLATDAPILSTIPPSSFAGMSLTLLPWLLSGGTLTLHHAFDPDTFAAQSRDLQGGALVVPGPAIAAITATGALDARSNTVLALWRSPERLATCAPWRGATKLIDIASFGEIGLIAGRRDVDGQPAPILVGKIGVPRTGAVAVTEIEAFRARDGAWKLRGAMVPSFAFPLGAEQGPETHIETDALGYVESGFGCRLADDRPALAITGPRGGLTTLGAYRFRQHDIDRLVAEVDPSATIIALPDALLGQRLAGSAADNAGVAAQLTAAGVNPLIVRAFQPRRAV
jgi:hypothetical protein